MTKNKNNVDQSYFFSISIIRNTPKHVYNAFLAGKQQQPVIHFALFVSGRVQDPTSDMNTAYGLPDPTFGLEHDEQSSWDLALEEIGGSFRTDCICNVLDDVLIQK